MAALYEGYTLCGLVPAQNLSNSGIQGIEVERDTDHVVVTDSTRSVTLYKVSDQKPLGSWTVKQEQTLTCPVVYNSQTKEYVAVSDNKVVRIWKEDDILLDKAFRATVSSNVWRVHTVVEGEPIVVFQKGAVRLLDSLLSAPQQNIEEVFSQDEAIRSTHLPTAGLYLSVRNFLIVDFSKCLFALNTYTVSPQKGDHFLYLQRLNPNSLQRYRLEREEPGLSPLSFSASYRDKQICLLYLYPNGHVYQSVVSVRGLGAGDGVQAVPLPRSLVLSLPVGEGMLETASALVLDEAHVAFVGVPHPSAGTGKDFLCIWNTNFQTLQAGKEMAGKIYGQLWSFSSKLFIPHGKTLSVIPYECPKSSLASALGKLKQARAEGKLKETSSVTMVTISENASDKNGKILNLADIQDLQTSVGQLTSALVSRSLAEPSFYTPSTLAQLVRTQSLCHSVCPDLVLLALEKKDYFLCQLCLQFFPDIPDAVTCACLRAFISMPDIDAEKVSLEPDSVAFMEMLMSKDHGQVGVQNGFSPTSLQKDCSVLNPVKTSSPPEQICPVGLHKAVLLNEVLQTAYSENFLLPHLKDLSSQHVILFLRYLQFLYLKYSQDAFPQMHGLRSPSLVEIMDWVCLLLDAHFTVLVMTPEAKGLLLNLHRFVKSQVRLFSELGKIEGSLQEINQMKGNKDIRQYSIEIIELF
uniref:Nucleolar protein 11 n=1 Tax=Sphaeramia orbicularis TaxID=375764 RepID=A0A673CDV2_9TELE